MVEKKEIKQDNETMDMVEGEKCPVCGKNTLTLIEREMDIPYFGKVYLFSMSCSSCGYHKADVESAEHNEPTKYEFDITKEEDLNVRVVKSASATVKIPYIGSIEPSSASNGYITNIEGILNRLKHQIELMKEDDDPKIRKKAKNLLKKIINIKWGKEKAKLIIEDPTGNSAIISEKAKVSRLKKKN